MKKITAIALFAICGLLAAGKAIAQEHSVQATIPFNFSVNNKVLPAGTYTITRESANLILIHNLHTTGAWAIAVPDASQSANRKQLVFARYGDQYFLREILCGADTINLKLPETRREKQVQQQQAMLQTPAQVLIAAR
ncbi:MAG: hypothetical protein JOZ33_01190 [Acidobacteriaceae bacterium]|nr:hypothetical protein [Acidobacteriaceae bacterium]